MRRTRRLWLVALASAPALVAVPSRAGAQTAPAAPVPAVPSPPPAPDVPAPAPVPEVPSPALGSAEAAAGVAFGADEVRLDTKTQSLDVAGHVRVDEPPFHLSSDALAMKRVPIGVELAGHGILAFCPCLGTPLSVRFSGATVAPPYDVILKQPVLDVFGVPIAWAPAVWLRSRARPGLLPPDLGWRGADGFFAGGGVHLPWFAPTRAGAASTTTGAGDAAAGLDLRAGGYVEGGFAVQTDLATEATRTRIGWDRFRGEDGVSLDASGASSPSANPSVSWRIAALRGERAVRATTDVGQAAQAFDRGAAEARWTALGWTVASRVEAVAIRGGDAADLGASGPVLVVRRSDAMGPGGTYDATLEGGQLASALQGATSFARGEAHAQWAWSFGPAATSVALHGVGQVADDGTERAAAGAAQLRGRLGVPLIRAFGAESVVSGGAALPDPWVHTTEPYVEAAAIETRAADAALLPAARGMTAPNGEAWVASAGWTNAIGQWGARTSGELDVAAGLVGSLPASGEVSGAEGVVRARASVQAPVLSLRADAARVIAGADSRGGAFSGTLRAGSRSGLHAGAHVAERDGVDPVLARALVDPTLEPASGFFAATGWTAGADAGVPFGSRITLRASSDADLTARELVAVGGAIELHDPCGCVVLRANGAERIGRGGVDVWLSIDLPGGVP
ncbi:MAG TPA: hypothetical protein VK841_18695 [Polyangiaceae bacterium]|nr:hypothetical protein [Polyangiaceae bacterium]